MKFERTLKKYKESNHSKFIFIKIIKKEECWASYAIDRLKDTFDLRGSSIS